MRALLYARVSTSEQVEGYSIDAQLRACREYCASHGWTIVAERVEPGKSARTEDIRKRPEFSAVLADADNHACDVILVHKLDRFSRSLRVTLEGLDRLARASVGLVSITEQLDYSSPQGRLFVHMLGTLAQFYSDNLGQEVRKGKSERFRQGMYNGHLPFGLVPGGDGLPVPDRRTQPDGQTTHWDVLQLAARLAADGLSPARLADELTARGYRTARGTLWTRESLHCLLANRILIGELPLTEPVGKRSHRRIIGWVPAKHAPVIDPDLFRRIQTERATRSTRRIGSVARGMTTHTLTGLLVCDYCREAGRPSPRVHVQCQHSPEPRCVCAARMRGIACPQRSCNQSVIVGQIAEWLTTLAVPSDAVSRALAQLEQPRDPLDAEAERRRLTEAIARLRDLYTWGDLTATDYQSQRSELQARLDALAPRPAVRADLEGLAAVLADAPRTFAALRSGEERNEWLRAVVAEVVVRDAMVVRIVPRSETELLLSSP